MKFKGNKLSGPKPKPVIFPREGGNVEILVYPVFSIDKRFEEFYPEPTPPVTKTPGSAAKEYGYDDPNYLKSLQLRDKRKTLWVIYESIRQDENIEFEDIHDPEKNVEELDKVEDQLHNFLVSGEFLALSEKVVEVNMPSQQTLKETIDFFAKDREKE